MTDRELCAAIRQRFNTLRAAVHKRRIELIAETEAELFNRYQEENERLQELNRRLKEITDEANRRVVDLLREFEDLAAGGHWKGSRHAMFEVPRVHRASIDRAQRHRSVMADIDRQTSQALQALERQQVSLLRSPERARILMAKGAPAIVTGLIPPTRLWDVIPLDATATA